MKKNEISRSKKTAKRKSVEVLIALICLVQFSMPLCFSQGTAGIPSSVKNPRDLEKWLSGFKSQMTLPDVPQTVNEMLSTRAGDCDDFSTLTSKVLTDLGISNTVLVIKFKNTNIRHAICLWKDESGSFDFFTTKRLVHTGKKSVDDVMKRYYPTSDSAVALDIAERDVP